MKRYKARKQTLFTIAFIMLTVQSYAQNFSNQSLEFKVGANLSDANYGTEIFKQYLPVEDYYEQLNIGDADFGLYTGLGFTYLIRPRIQWSTSLEYNRWNYQIFGLVQSQRPDIDRPSGVALPFQGDGNVYYSFLSVETALRFSINKDMKKGLFLGLYIRDMMHLNTSWDVDVTYEDNRIENINDFATFDNTEYEDIWILGINAGYNLMLNDKFSISPTIDFGYGLDPLVEDGLNPLVIRAGLSTQWWFNNNKTNDKQ